MQLKISALLLAFAAAAVATPTPVAHRVEARDGVIVIINGTPARVDHHNPEDHSITYSVDPAAPKLDRYPMERKHQANSHEAAKSAIEHEDMEEGSLDAIFFYGWTTESSR